MNVHFDQFQIADDDDAVTDGHELFTQPVDIGKRGLFLDIDDKKFRTISEFNHAQVENIGVLEIVVVLFVLVDYGDRSADIFPDQSLIHAFIETHQPFAAGIHDAGLFEDGKQLGGELHRFVSLFQDFREIRFKIPVFRFDILGVLRHHSGNREHGAFFRFGDRIVCDLRAHKERFGK